MLEYAIKSLMHRRYHGYKLFLHNFSYFDGMFLLRILSKLSDDIKPIVRDGKMIELRFKYNKDDKGKYKNTLYFRDSLLLLLPTSLADLAINFKLDNKGIFPYTFADVADLDYVGKIPEYKFFDNLTLDEYQEYCKQFDNKQWSLPSG